MSVDFDDFVGNAMHTPEMSSTSVYNIFSTLSCSYIYHFIMITTGSNHFSYVSNYLLKELFYHVHSTDHVDYGKHLVVILSYFSNYLLKELFMLARLESA